MRETFVLIQIRNSYFALGAILFTLDFFRGLKLDTYIPSRCFQVANAIIIVCIIIGDEVINEAGPIMIKNIPSNNIIVENPQNY